MDGAPPDSAYDAAKRAGRAALRTRLVRVAAERLEAVGIEALSMRPLASAAGCSTMVFYTEFGSKEGLLEALADDRAERILEAVETVADDDVAEHRRAVVRAFLAAVAEAPAGYRTLTRSAADDATARLVAERRDAFDERLAEALRAGAPAAADDRLRGLVLALHGAAERVVAGAASPDDLTDVIAALARERP